MNYKWTIMCLERLKYYLVSYAAPVKDDVSGYLDIIDNCIQYFTEHSYEQLTIPDDYSYQNLLAEGQEIFRAIVPDLNNISKEHIRIKTADYRRKQDFEEICIALALAKKHIKSTAEKDRHYICEMGRLFWKDDKQCYAADAVYRKVKKLLEQEDNDESTIESDQVIDSMNEILSNESTGFSTRLAAEEIKRQWQEHLARIKEIKKNNENV